MIGYESFNGKVGGMRAVNGVEENSKPWRSYVGRKEERRRGIVMKQGKGSLEGTRSLDLEMEAPPSRHKNRMFNAPSKGEC